MHRFLHPYVYLVVFTCFCQAASLGSEGETKDGKSFVTIDAAYNYKAGPGMDMLLLFSGNMVAGLQGKEEAFVSKKKTFRIPDGINIQATFIKDPNDPGARYYYGDKYGYLINNADKILVKKFKYGRRRAFIKNGGPDAIGRRAGVAYVFKGCKVAIRGSWRNWKLHLNDISTIGLPCNLDAAWGETEGAMIALKGNQFWRWESDGSVNGPHAFHDTYKMKSWILKPSEESS